MSSAIAFFSSSSRSLRSTNALSCSFPNFIAGCSAAAAAAVAILKLPRFARTRSKQRAQVRWNPRITLGQEDWESRLWSSPRTGHPQQCTGPASRLPSVLLHSLFERGLLLRRGLFLVLRLPLVEGHAV